MLQNVQPDFNETNVNSDAFIKNADKKLDAPSVAGTAGQVLTKTANGQEWADVGEDKINYLCFESEATGNTIVLNKSNSSMPDVDIEYSFDKKNWTTYTWSGTYGATINFDAGDVVYFRGNNSSFSTSTSNYFNFGFGWNKEVKASGDVMSLLSKDLSNTSLTGKNYVFYKLFNNCQFMKTAPKIGSTTHSTGCFYAMFISCKRLESIPDFGSGDLANECYKEMFRNCQSLVKAPRFGTGGGYMRQSCYESMFASCTSLKEISDFTMNNLAASCFSSMFSGCTSLTKAISLPLTSLPIFCYNSMFSGCTSLTQMPNLPATTLSQSCYRSMFSGCTSLKTAEFKATDVSAQECCRGMFSGCTNLTFIKTHFSGTIGYFAFYEFLNNASAYGVVENPNTLSDTSFLPEGWILASNANIPDNGTTSVVEASSGDTYCVCPSSEETGVLTVDSALTLNAMTTASTDIAYAEVVLDIASNATVTAGTNMTFVDDLTVGKRNVCVVRWSDGAAKMYVTIVEDIPQA